MSDKNIDHTILQEEKSGVEVIDVQSEGSNDFIKYIKDTYYHENITWSRADEIVVKKYIMKAHAYRTLYNKSYYSYNLYYNLLVWPLIITTCVSIASQMISATLIIGNVVGDNSGVLSIITTSISIIVTILTYLQNRTLYQKSAKGCKMAVRAFSDFIDQLHNILTINRKYRANPLIVINTIQSDYRKIIRLYSEYEIPSHILSAFIKKNKDSPIIIDLSTNTLDHIDISYGTIERNLIIDKFLESLSNLKKEEKEISSKQDESIIDI
jgi:hypothetical protein